MQILAFSDVHTDLAACERLVQQAQSNPIDVVVGAGDFATMRKGLQPVLECLGQIRQPLVLVPGNGESLEELQAVGQAFPQMHVLHGGTIDLNGWVFFGLGYAVPETPFGAWSCDLSEREAEELLQGCPERAILVTHSPPYGHVDQNRQGQHVGSRAIAAVIERRKPRLVVCGHVHDCWQQNSRLGETPIHNLGPVGTILTVS